jgi:hypothetical protein
MAEWPEELEPHDSATAHSEETAQREHEAWQRLYEYAQREDDSRTWRSAGEYAQQREASIHAHAHEQTRAPNRCTCHHH